MDGWDLTGRTAPADKHLGAIYTSNSRSMQTKEACMDLAERICSEDDETLHHIITCTKKCSIDAHCYITCTHGRCSRISRAYVYSARLCTQLASSASNKHLGFATGLGIKINRVCKKGSRSRLSLFHLNELGAGGVIFSSSPIAACSAPLTCYFLRSKL